MRKIAAIFLTNLAFSAALTAIGYLTSDYLSYYSVLAVFNVIAGLFVASVYMTGDIRASYLTLYNIVAAASQYFSLSASWYLSSHLGFEVYGLDLLIKVIPYLVLLYAIMTSVVTLMSIRMPR